LVVHPIVRGHHLHVSRANVVTGVAAEATNPGVVIVGDSKGELLARSRAATRRRRIADLIELITKPEERQIRLGAVESSRESGARGIGEGVERREKGSERAGVALSHRVGARPSPRRGEPSAGDPNARVRKGGEGRRRNRRRRKRDGKSGQLDRG